MWILIVFVDTFLSALRHVYLPTLLGYTVIVDRFAIDPLIDTVVSSLWPKNENLIFTRLGNLFVKLIPRNALVLVLDVEEGIAASRKNYTGDTRSLARSRALYRSLGKSYRWNFIYTDEPIAEVHEKIMDLMTVSEQPGDN